MSRKNVLCIVTDNFAQIQKVIEPLVPSCFCRMVIGKQSSDFEAERKSDDPLVLLLGGPGSHDVVRGFLTKEEGSVLLAPNPRIQWIHSLWTGVDAFRFQELGEGLTDVPISNTRGVFAPMLAQHVMLSCLYFNRNVCKIQHDMKERKWDKSPSPTTVGQKMGIVGYGNIGVECGRQAVSMGMEVTGFKRSKPSAAVDSYGVKLVHGTDALAELLETSDFVLNVLPKTTETHHLLGIEAFRKMKSDCVFINIGRGTTVDENALFTALSEHRLKGAALDVMETEPLPQESPIWELPPSKLLLTPHNADVSTTIHEDAAKQFASHAISYVKSGTFPAEHRVCPAKGY